MVWLALVASTGFAAPSLAQKSETAALKSAITEPSRAGKYSEATPLAQRLLTNREQAFGPSDRDVAATLNNLAALYQSQERYADAEPLFKRSLRSLEETSDATGCSRLSIKKAAARAGDVKGAAEPSPKIAIDVDDG
jgi:tetratricopeptide (TPR) repeat protein